MKTMLLTALVGLGLLSAPWDGLAQLEVQDRYVLERSWPHGLNLTDYGFSFGVAADKSGMVYLASGTHIAKFDALGSNTVSWAFAGARGLHYYAPSNLLATSSSTLHQIRLIDTNGNVLVQWGSAGSNASQFNAPYAVAVGPDALVYVADTGNNRIQVFNLNGTFVRQWGEFGTTGGKFNSPRGIAVGPDNTVYVADNQNRRIQAFDSSGNFLRQHLDSGSWQPKAIACAPDGTLIANESVDSWRGRWFSSDLTQLSEFTFSQVQGHAWSPDGEFLFRTTWTRCYVYRRVYRTLGSLQPNKIPQPALVSVAQRSGTSLVDLDLVVTDGDSSNVTAAAVAFLDGRRDLAAVIPMLTYTNTSDVQLPATVSANTKYRATWDAGTDWPTNYGNMKVTLLAKDERGLLDFHLLTIPTINPYTNNLTISRFPYTETDFLDLWTWLVATGHSSINLQTGTVTAVTGDYGVANGTVLAQTAGTTTTTTPNGRTFLWSMLSSNLASTTYSNMVLREATTNELFRAKMGTTGRINQWTPRVSIGGRPSKINEFGFDTGLFNTNNPASNPTNAWWVVMEPK